MNVLSELLTTKQGGNKEVVWLRDITWKCCYQKRINFNLLHYYLY